MQSENTRRTPPVYKIIILGESNVGKSSLFLRYLEDRFKDALANTIGINNTFKELVIDGNTVHLQMWDTAGQERFRSIVSGFYRESDGFVLVYDVTSERSFDYLAQLIRELHDCIDPRFTVLVGNKTDCIASHALMVEQERLQEMAKEHGFKSFFTSAKTGEGVNDMFEDLSRNLYYNKMKEETDYEKIDMNIRKKKKHQCC